jgi:hypothetical protein
VESHLAGEAVELVGGQENHMRCVSVTPTRENDRRVGPLTITRIGGPSCRMCLATDMLLVHKFLPAVVQLCLHLSFFSPAPLFILAPSSRAFPLCSSSAVPTVFPNSGFVYLQNALDRTLHS